MTQSRIMGSFYQLAFSLEIMTHWFSVKPEQINV